MVTQPTEQFDGYVSNCIWNTLHWALDNGHVCMHEGRGTDQSNE